jgi:hypothetical protein
MPTILFRFETGGTDTRLNAFDKDQQAVMLVLARHVHQHRK